ncbi:unnamed protein product [Rhizophagus irregularis]|nr:unnamed protein product [Rhizophagus irregularis]
MQQKFYYFFMKRCPELKYLDMRSIKHQIFYFPEARARLESLCELKCDTSIDSSYFYGLSSLCQYIQSLIIINTDPKPNHGIVKFIEVQNNLKHFEWKDYFDDDILTEDPYEEVFCALEKKADSLNYLRIYFQYVDNIEETSLQKILPKLYKLKILTLNDYRLFTNEQLEQLRIQVYHDLEILSLEWNSFNSLNFIRKIYENCPSIEYLTITFPPSEEHFAEFEKLLKICQNIKSLLIIIYNVDKIETSEKILENGKILLEILVRSAPTNLKEIRFYEDFKFSLENLEDFLEKWRGRPAISILTSDPIYERENYEKLINKYQEYGVIKIFKHSLFVDEIDYHFMYI